MFKKKKETEVNPIFRPLKPAPVKMVKTAKNKMSDGDANKESVNKPKPFNMTVRMVANANTPKMDYVDGRVYSVDKKEYEMIKQSSIILKK